MSGETLGEALPVSGFDKQNDVSGKGSLVKSRIENADENLEKSQNKSSAKLNELLVETNGAEAGNVEVEYIESENLNDLPSVDETLQTLLTRLDSKDWVVVCEALNNVRKLTIYHREKLLDMLGTVIALVVKSLKNPRSAVCKTAIMTSADIFRIYCDLVVDSLDPLLVQLLLKASQDKRFVCEAAVTALIAMTTWVSPSLLLPKLQSYLKHKNPRIRAKASMCFSRSVQCLGSDGIIEYGMSKLVQIASSQLSDQLPESREAARMLALELRATYEKKKCLVASSSFSSSSSQKEGKEEEESTTESWETLCQTELSPLSAQAILRVTTSTLKDGLTTSGY